MTNKRKPVSGRRSLLLLLLFTNIIFFVMYRRFWFGDATYFYTDIGSDGFTSSYPIIAMLGRLVRSGDISAYSLEAGLGTDISTLLMQYINPVKAVLLIFPKDFLPTGIMIFLLIQTNLTAIISWAYFRLLLGHTGAAFFPALIFTFSSYALLWSQNITFGTGILMFILTMYVFERYLRLRTRRSWLVLAPVIALFVITNYYFLYMTGIFMILYLAVHTIAGHGKLSGFFKDLLRLAGAAVFGGLISLFALIPTISAFMNSARTGDVSRSTAGILKAEISPRKIVTILGRLISPNALGIGDSYQGSVNYFEDALIFTSILAFFAFFYLIFASRLSRRITLITAALSAASLIFPIFGQLLNFNLEAERFSFMICFAEAIAAGLFMKHMLTDTNARALVLTLMVTPLSLAALVIIFIIMCRASGISPDTRSLKIALAFAALYELLLILHLLTVRPDIHVKRTSSEKQLIRVERFMAGAGNRLKLILPPVFLAAVSLETVIIGSDMLYLRPYVTKDAFRSSYYNNGNEAASSAITENDSDLFRITPFTDNTSQLSYANDSMVNGYRGMSIYYNANSSSLISLADFFGIYQNQPSYFCVGTDAYDLFTLLGGRYLITGSDYTAEEPDSSLFEKADILNSEEKIIYKNKNALPFGYFYTYQFDRDTLDSLPAHIRGRALTRGFVYTDNNSGTSLPEASVDGLYTETQLTADDVQSPNNVSVTPGNEESFSAEATGEDPNFSFSDAGYFSTGGSDTLHLRLSEDSLSSELTHIEVFIMTDEVPVPDASYSRTLVFSPNFPEADITLPEGTKGVRIDIEDDSTVHFDSITVLHTSDPEDEYSALRSADISNISFSSSVYSADIETQADGMLCVPLLWSENWDARINGEPAEVYNINGGLCGIKLSSGTSRITISYVVPHFRLALAVSLIVFAFWCFLMGQSYKTKDRLPG